MPALVEKKEAGSRGAIYEVKWTWMPVFLAQDADLIREVDQRLNQLFAGGDPPMPGVMEKVVVDTICQKYPMEGLRAVLEKIQEVDPTIRLHLVEELPTTSLGSGAPSPTSKLQQRTGSPGGQE